MQKATLQRSRVIGAVCLQNSRGRQDDAGKYPQRLPGDNTEEVAQLGCGLMQILIENKNPEPDEVISQQGHTVTSSPRSKSMSDR